MTEPAGKDFTSGGILGMPKYPVTTGDASCDKKVEQLVREWNGRADPELIEEMVVSALKFAQQDISVADLKLINRTLKELRAANRVFFPYQNRKKVVVYGSARTKTDQAEAQTAEKFAAQMAKEGYMVITGAGDGIMGAAQKGAGRENGFGLNIKLPFEQEANDTILGDKKLVTFNYFFTRKLTFVKEAEAIALFPGGFGTMDEGFEVLTLMQTGKSHILPVVLVDAPGGTYWKTFVQFLRDHLLRRGLISEDDFSLFRITDNCDEAVREITQFYRVFHSYRYGKDVVVFRLNQAIRHEEVYILNKEFPDLIAEGRIEQTGPHPMEGNEPDLASLPRLVFRPKRGNYGRVRELINAINKAEVEIKLPTVTDKKRLDLAMVERGLCESREQARRLILAGEAIVNGHVVDKPSSQVKPHDAVDLKVKPRYVSRGGLKLEGALLKFGVDPENLVCLDAGASTGGFTDCLLQNGARKVYAFDVGTNQLAWKLRSHPRVVSREQFNLRHLDPDDVPEPVDLAVFDVSFISLTLVLPPVIRALRPGSGQVICLIKPQFEVGREDVGKGGIVRDPELHQRAVDKIRVFIEEHTELQWRAVMESPIQGTDGNKEFLAWITHQKHSA